MTIPAGGETVPDLFWSLGGEIACREHAPTYNGRRWIEEGWTQVVALSSVATDYHCNRCRREPLDRNGKAT